MGSFPFLLISYDSIFIMNAQYVSILIINEITHSELRFLKQGRPRTFLLRLSVCPSVRPSVCPVWNQKKQPKFGRLKTKFHDDGGSAKRTWGVCVFYSILYPNPHTHTHTLQMFIQPSSIFIVCSFSWRNDWRTEETNRFHASATSTFKI